jgi:hypothetical protein
MAKINIVEVAGFSLDLATEWPLERLVRNQVSECLDAAMEARDVEMVTLALNDLDRRGRAKFAHRKARRAGIAPITWLQQAKSDLRKLEQPPINRSNGHLYAVLMESPSERLGRYSVYVGATYRRPENRLEQHLAGGRLASRKVRRRGSQLLKSLCWPWRTVPGKKLERLDWESALHECLAISVPKVEGDSHPEKWSDDFQKELSGEWKILTQKYQLGGAS